MALAKQYVQQTFESGVGLFGPFDITTKTAATIEADFHAGSGTVVVRKTNLPLDTNPNDLNGAIVSSLTNGVAAFKYASVLAANECFRQCFARITVTSGTIGLRFLSQPGSI